MIKKLRTIWSLKDRSDVNNLLGYDGGGGVVADEGVEAMAAWGG